MKTTKDRYWSHAHNLESGLRNGSFFVRRKRNNAIYQYINGDYMGVVEAVPESQAEVTAEVALKLLPKCCGGKG